MLEHSPRQRMPTARYQDTPGVIRQRRALSHDGHRPRDARTTGSPRGRTPGSSGGPPRCPIGRSPRHRRQPRTCSRGPAGAPRQRRAGEQLVPARSPASTAPPAGRAHLVRIRWAPVEREIAGDQLARRWPHHLPRRTRSEQRPATRHHHAVLAERSVVAVVITQRPEIPTHQPCSRRGAGRAPGAVRAACSRQSWHRARSRSAKLAANTSAPHNARYRPARRCAITDSSVIRCSTRVRASVIPTASGRASRCAGIRTCGPRLLCRPAMSMPPRAVTAGERVPPSGGCRCR